MKMNMTNDIYSYLKGDKAIWLIVVVLSIFSMLAVYSAAGSHAFKYRGGNTEFYLIQQFVFISLGLVVTYVCCNLHYMHYSRIAPILIAITIPLLLYTLAYGTEFNGGRRWISIPWIDRTIQTSDLAKLALIIFVARALSIRQEYIKDFKSAFVPIIFPVTVVCLLIAPADLSTAALLFVTCIIMMFIGRVSMRYISLLMFVGLVGFVGLIYIGENYSDVVRSETWNSRWTEFVNGEGWQIEQSKIAIANGGWIGKGPGMSFQRNHLPSSYTDFIYSIICEEYGLLGGFVILGLYLWLLIRCIRLVTRCPKAFGAILALGLCLNIVIQAFANIAVSVHLVPATGLTLPLVSSGGTSILFTCMSIGIILSVSRYVEMARIKSLDLSEIELRDESNI